MKKRAYLSVYDKSGILNLAKRLIDANYEIVATSSTGEFLKENKINYIKSSEITGFDELLGGRVKSLHPDIFASILAKPSERETLNSLPFSLIVIDLYPFENYINKITDTETLLENIDIGGVALLRAGAKNYENVIVISNKSQYDINFEDISVKDRENLALEAFQKCAKYDFIIQKVLGLNFGNSGLNNFEGIILNKIADLRYGENPHQKAALYSNPLAKVLDYEVLNGKALSYNNILDATSAIRLTSEFYDCPCAVIVKHTNPSGVALGSSIIDAWDKALDCDPISAFGGIVSLSRPVDFELSKKLTSMFLELVIAPDFEADALEQLKTKKNLRIIRINTPLSDIKGLNYNEFKQTPFGTLLQEMDSIDLDPATFKVSTKLKPTKEQIEDLVFAFKVCKYVKSNAIVVAKDLRTLGICGGQTSRIGAIEVAISRVCDSPKDAVIASDGFLPETDNIEVAAANRISAFIQPGGSIKDNDVISVADKYNLCIVNTGIRHFKH